jgi:hypothetical protein
VVRVFDAVTADFQKRVELLRAFGQLQESWRQPLERAAVNLEADRARRREAAARAVARTVADMLALKVEKTIDAQADPAPHQAALVDDYRRRLEALERSARQEVEAIYDHHDLDRREAALESLDAQDLFSVESWRVFGLTRLQLLTAGAVGGAVAGGAVDLATGGSSFLLGTLIGSGIGAATTFLAANKLVEVKLFDVAMGRKKLVAGPMKNPNFPHVVLGRARLHHALVAGRSHAQRGALAVDVQAEELLAPQSGGDRKALERCFARLRRGGDTVGVVDELAALVAEAFLRDEEQKRPPTSPTPARR